jgi:tetratricopeptide (TPR) repeat protein
VPDDTRIADLERRLEADPTSIAFAHLAEEYRRAGRLTDAVRVCRDGLTRYPAYASARVTLGRALLALAQHADARAELEAAMSDAPDNRAATRALEELSRLTGEPVRRDVVAQDRVKAAADHEVPPGWREEALQELEGWLASVRDDRASRQRAADTRRMEN